MRKLALFVAVTAACAFAAGLEASSSSASTVCLVSNAADWATNYEQAGGAGANCAYGSTLTFTGQSWTCSAPLATYGTLPLRVIVNEGTTTPAAWQGNKAGKVNLSSGCVGDSDPDTVDLIVILDGAGAQLDAYGNGQDAVKYNGTGPHDLEWTGEFQCGQEAPGAHQDGLQMQSGYGTTLVNGKSGHWDTGAATCAGAGGVTFYSSANGRFPSCVDVSCSTRSPVNIVGGEFVACGKGVYGGQDTAHGGGYPLGDGLTGTVSNAAYHTGGNLFSGAPDQNCGGIFPSNPCAAGNTVTMVDLTCYGGGEGPPQDTTRPTVTCSPGDQTVYTSSPAGKVASWTCSATDPDDQAGPVTCSPSSGSLFPIGSTVVTCSSTDTHGNIGTTSFTITVKVPGG